MSGININLAATFEQEAVFKECRHNHAASLGCIAYDGCHAFLKSSGSDVVNGGATTMLCGCHRNFHRRDTIYNPIMTTPSLPHHNHHQQPDFLEAAAGRLSTSTTRVVQLINQETRTTTMHAPPPPPAAGNNNNNIVEEATTEEVLPPAGRRKRTIFTTEQRNRLVRFAERLGWRPQRADKEEIHDFCMDMGISRRMFVVWLSNNRCRVAQPNTAVSTA